MIKYNNNNNLYFVKNKWSIKLDHKASLFQNLNGAVGDVEVRFTDEDAYIHNTAYHRNPIIIHGNGPSKVSFSLKCLKYI